MNRFLTFALAVFFLSAPLFAEPPAAAKAPAKPPASSAKKPAKGARHRPAAKPAQPLPPASTTYEFPLTNEEKVEIGRINKLPDAQREPAMKEFQAKRKSKPVKAIPIVPPAQQARKPTAEEQKELERINKLPPEKQPAAIEAFRKKYLKVAAPTPKKAAAPAK